jgi:hypothetical protein
VTIAKRIHLFPSRTQKLSSFAPKILGGRLPGRIGRCRFTNAKTHFTRSVFFVGAVASDAWICYTTTMIDTVPRYVFMTLLCLPVVLACAFLFDKLLVEVLEIHREKRARLERRRAGVSPYTSAFALAETCVFAKQSPGTFHCGPRSWAPLLPKLRGHFAEFLNNSSLARLRILSSSTCVGLRYGHLHSR